MKVMNISNVDDFFKVVDSCEGKVELVSKEGDRLNLKSTLTQYVALAKVFSNRYIRELELIVYETNDVKKFMEFLAYGKTE